MRLVVEAQAQGDLAQRLTRQHQRQRPLQTQLRQPLMRWQTGVLAETPQRLPRAHGAESGDFLQRGGIVQAALQPIAQPLPGLLIEDAMRLADTQCRAHLQQMGQRLPERFFLSQSRAAQHRRMKALQVL